MNDDFFMRIALDSAQKAFDEGEFPVGCALVHEDKILVTGARSGTKPQINEIDHAEMNTLRALARQNVAVPPGEISLYCTMEPCLMCYAAILLSGIGRIVYAYEDVMGGGISLNLAHAAPLYRSIPCEIVPHVRRTESLLLFQAYFVKPENLYWRDSLLATYTLAQN